MCVCGGGGVVWCVCARTGTSLTVEAGQLFKIIISLFHLFFLYCLFNFSNYIILCRMC